MSSVTHCSEFILQAQLLLLKCLSDNASTSLGGIQPFTPSFSTDILKFVLMECFCLPCLWNSYLFNLTSEELYILLFSAKSRIEIFGFPLKKWILYHIMCAQEREWMCLHINNLQATSLLQALQNLSFWNLQMLWLNNSDFFWARWALEHILKDKQKLRDFHNRKAQKLLNVTLNCIQLIAKVKAWFPNHEVRSRRPSPYVPY